MQGEVGEGVVGGHGLPAPDCALTDDERMRVKGPPRSPLLLGQALDAQLLFALLQAQVLLGGGAGIAGILWRITLPEDLLAEPDQHGV